jgi:SpoIID/LytB domain protein
VIFMAQYSAYNGGIVSGAPVIREAPAIPPLIGGQSVRVRAEDLRLALVRSGARGAKGLYSMNCAIRDAGDAVVFCDGRGFGHGVGLSQWGAQDKAARGWPAEKILGFYYPGATLYRAY